MEGSSTLRTVSSPAVAVVLPCHNGGAFLAEQLTALRHQRFDREWELVFVDNASTDDSADVFAAAMHHQHCHTKIVLEPILGLNRARNAGIRASSAPLVALCDADDVADPGWLFGIVTALEAGHGLVGGILDVSVLNSDRTRYLNGLPMDHPGTWEVASGVRAAVGANCGFTRELWALVGGFDEAFASGGDDTEFGIRCSLAGSPAEPAVDARMYYRLRAERRAVFRCTKRDDEARARIYSQYRHVGISRRSTLLALKALLYCARELVLWPLRSDQRRDRLARALGSSAGRIAGSIRYRTYFP